MRQVMYLPTIMIFPVVLAVAIVAAAIWYGFTGRVPTFMQKWWNINEQGEINSSDDYSVDMPPWVGLFILAFVLVAAIIVIAISIG